MKIIVHGVKLQGSSNRVCRHELRPSLVIGITGIITYGRGTVILRTCTNPTTDILSSAITFPPLLVGARQELHFRSGCPRDYQREKNYVQPHRPHRVS